MPKQTKIQTGYSEKADIGKDEDEEQIETRARLEGF